MKPKIDQAIFSSPTYGFEALVGEEVVAVEAGPDFNGGITTIIRTRSGKAFMVFTNPEYRWEIAYLAPAE